MATPKTPHTVSDPKKRAFEALERRFTAAKAEHLQQQHKIKKRDTQEEDHSRSDCASPAPVLNPSSPHSLIHSSNKGRLASWSRTPSSGTPRISSGTPQASSGTPRVSDIETQGPAYSQLAQPVHENLLKTDFKLSGQRGSTAEKIMHELLRRGDSAHKYLQGSKSMKLDNWLLLDSVVQGRGTDRDARIKSFQSHSKRSKRHMSLEGHRKYLIYLSQCMKCGKTISPNYLKILGRISCLVSMPSFCRLTWCCSFSCAQKGFRLHVSNFLLEDHTAWGQTLFEKHYPMTWFECAT